ncbi:MAG: hypothetical protein H6671_04565 [Anaerolineaceae bacterium]|nr:hypothetical protein [Anaerolineaceae bacterium]
MALKLPVQYEQLVELVEQLSEEQQNDLIARLLTLQAEHRTLTVEEKIKLLDAIKLNVAINEEPSVRRVDWYDDDGR